MIGKSTSIQNLDEASAASIVKTALQIAEERLRMLEKMRAALLSDDHKALKRVASELCGLEHD